MKAFIPLFLLVILSNWTYNLHAQATLVREIDETELSFSIENGNRISTCKDNGYSQSFVVGKGKEVTISAGFANFLMKNAYLTTKDIVGELKYDNDGFIANGTIINVHRIRFDYRIALEDVKVRVVKGQNSILIIGEKAIKTIGNFKIDNKKKVLRISKRSPRGNGPKISEDQVVKETVFDVVDEMPSFPGGINGLINYLSSNIIYPPLAEELGIQGKVIVSFVVETDGTISNTTIENEAHPLLDAESIRVVSIMPKWKAGSQNGTNIRVKYNLPVTFKLQ